MNISTIFASLSGFLPKIQPKEWLFLSLSAVGLMSVIAGFTYLYFSFRTAPPDSNVGQNEVLSTSALNEADDTQESSISASDSSSASFIQVDVSGAVLKPGMYQLNAEARVGEAITRAGGLQSSADPTFVAQSLNLAAKTEDGAKIYIPFRGDKSVQAGESAQTDGISTATSTNNTVHSSLVSINDASLAELDSLSGVGQTRAKAIIQNRPFTSIDELLSKKIIPASVFDKLKNTISL